MSKQSSLKTCFTSWRGYHFGGNPVDFVSQIMEFVNDLPQGAQDIYLDISTEGDYGGDVAVIDVKYLIPYTQEELDKIKQDKKNAETLSYTKKLELYNQLKKEFE